MISIVIFPRAIIDTWQRNLKFNDEITLYRGFLRMGKENQEDLGINPESPWVLALKVVCLTFLLIGLLSVDYIGMKISSTLLQTPIRLVLVALADTLLFTYVVKHSQWKGWKEWMAIFCILYGFVYVLTAFESVYLGSILTAMVAAGLLINGAIVSVIFSAVIVWVLGQRAINAEALSPRLVMRTIEWIWKIVLAAIVYLLVFIIFGLLIYYPIAQALDPTALAAEQSIASSAAALVFPIELMRGALWMIFSVPTVVSLRFGWRKTAVVIGLLLAVPLSGASMLSTSMSLGLQIAHFVELFTENLVFGFIVVWILHLRSRLP